MFIRAFVTAAIALTTMVGCIDMFKNNDHGVISGQVYYLQRIALPSDANLTVVLADVSRADAPMEVISSQTYSTQGKQVPLPFTLSYPMSEIKQKNTYTVSARIEVNGELIFINDASYRVLTDPEKTEQVKIKLVSTAH